MATEPDPYRTLGLARTASLAEVKAAYRRLAKANHPDAAGEAALPRFLAIQAAYERLAGPTPGRPRTTPSPPPAPRQAWEADPGTERRDASGLRRAGVADSAGSTSGKPRRPAGVRRRTGRGRGATGSSGGTKRPAGEGTKDPKKATLGSTSYDEVDREAFEPDWGGASWYGTTSGTYWTINPKEYADPRKHGPEYQAQGQARERRPARSPRRGVGAGGAAATSADERGPGAAGPATPRRAGDPARRGRVRRGRPRSVRTPRLATRHRRGGTRRPARSRRIASRAAAAAAAIRAASPPDGVRPLGRRARQPRARTPARACRGSGGP